MSSSTHSLSAASHRSSLGRHASQFLDEILQPRVAQVDENGDDDTRAAPQGSSGAPDSFVARLYPTRARPPAHPAKTTSSPLVPLPSPVASPSRLPQLSRIPPRLPPTAIPPPRPTHASPPAPVLAAPAPTLPSSSAASTSTTGQLPTLAAQQHLKIGVDPLATRRSSLEASSASSSSHGHARPHVAGRSRLFALSLERVVGQYKLEGRQMSSSALRGGEHGTGGVLERRETSIERAGGQHEPRAAQPRYAGAPSRTVRPLETTTLLPSPISAVQLAPRSTRTINAVGVPGVDGAASTFADPPLLLKIKGASRADSGLDLVRRQKRKRSPSPSSSPPVKRPRAAPMPPILPPSCPWASSAHTPQRTWNDPISHDQIGPRWNDYTVRDFAPFLHDEHVEPALFDRFYEEQIELLRACASVAEWYPDPSCLGARMTRLPRLVDQVGARQPRRSAIRAAVGPLRSATGYNELDDKTRRLWKWLGKVVAWVWLLGGGSATVDEVSYVVRTAPQPVMLIFRHLAHVLALRELIDHAYELLRAHLERRRRAFTATAREAAALVLLEWLARTGPFSPKVSRRALFFSRADGHVRRDDEGERPWTRWLARADRGERCSEHRLDDWERDVLVREGREWGVDGRRAG
ncbi:hypothetical protein JCM9279_003850 [Rhodotorula babjevae]